MCKYSRFQKSDHKHPTARRIFQPTMESDSSRALEPARVICMATISNHSKTSKNQFIDITGHFLSVTELLNASISAAQMQCWHPFFNCLSSPYIANSSSVRSFGSSLSDSEVEKIVTSKAQSFISKQGTKIKADQFTEIVEEDRFDRE